MPAVAMAIPPNATQPTQVVRLSLSRIARASARRFCVIARAPPFDVDDSAVAVTFGRAGRRRFIPPE
jgi:hypothetical protein